jgi:hypothetical protein
VRRHVHVCDGEGENTGFVAEDFPVNILALIELKNIVIPLAQAFVTFGFGNLLACVWDDPGAARDRVRRKKASACNTGFADPEQHLHRIRASMLAGRRKRWLPRHIFDTVIPGYQTGRMFGDMKPAFLGTGKQAYLRGERCAMYGVKRQLVQPKRFLHRCSTITAVEGSRWCSHGEDILTRGGTVFGLFSHSKTSLATA